MLNDPDDLKAKDAIVSARINMLINNPFWGNIATRLVLVHDDSIDTAATDGRHLFYNPKFILKLQPLEVVFLVGHELLHVVYDHIGEHSRLGTRNFDMWNVAADYSVNRDLVKHKIGVLITTVPILYDKKYDDMTTEEIYEHLKKNSKESISNLLGKMLDSHSKGTSDSETHKAIRESITEAILASAASVEPGSVPESIKRFIKDITEPKMNWREIIFNQISSQITSDYSFMKPSRRSFSIDAILPSMMKVPTIECTLALDMSGSITDQQIKEFFGEIKGIMEQHQSVKISILSFDTKAHNYQEYDEYNITDILSYQPIGGGGTDFSCVYDLLKELDKIPKQLIFFTDLLTSNFGDPNYCPTTFLVNGGYGSSVAPFGTTIYYDEA